MITFGFYNSLNHDRAYDAVQMSSIFDGIIEDGVYSNIGEFFATVPGTGMGVIVKTGRAWFNHTWTLNDAHLPLDVEESDFLQTRIDAVVLEVDSRIEKRENSIKIVKGIPSVNPVKPTLLNDGGVYQHPLSYITVGPGVTSITAENIEISVGTEDCPFVTAPLQTVSIEDLWQQWDYQFNTWFDNLKAAMTDNVVTNLQYQIDQKVATTDKASAEDIKNATPGKWVDSAMVNKTLIYGIENGGIVWSPDDLEVISEGEFLALDQRSIKKTDLSDKIVSAFSERIGKPKVISNLPNHQSWYPIGTLKSTPYVKEYRPPKGVAIIPVRNSSAQQKGLAVDFRDLSNVVTKDISSTMYYPEASLFVNGKQIIVEEMSINVLNDSLDVQYTNSNPIVGTNSVAFFDETNGRYFLIPYSQTGNNFNIVYSDDLFISVPTTVSIPKSTIIGSVKTNSTISFNLLFNEMFCFQTMNNAGSPMHRYSDGLYLAIGFNDGYSTPKYYVSVVKSLDNGLTWSRVGVTQLDRNVTYSSGSILWLDGAIYVIEYGGYTTGLLYTKINLSNFSKTQFNVSQIDSSLSGMYPIRSFICELGNNEYAVGYLSPTIKYDSPTDLASGGYTNMEDQLENANKIIIINAETGNAKVHSIGPYPNYSYFVDGKFIVRNESSGADFEATYQSERARETHDFPVYSATNTEAFVEYSTGKTIMMPPTIYSSYVTSSGNQLVYYGKSKIRTPETTNIVSQYNLTVIELDDITLPLMPHYYIRNKIETN